MAQGERLSRDDYVSPRATFAARNAPGKDDTSQRLSLWANRRGPRCGRRARRFALAHPAYSFLPVLIFGLISGALMLGTRSLAACVVAHALHNAIALSLS